MSNLMSKTETTTLDATADYFYAAVGGASDRRFNSATLFKSFTGNYSTNALSLSSVLSAIGTNQGTIEIGGSVTVSADTTIPSNVTLIFVGTGGFSINSGKVLTIKGPIFAAGRQIFAGAGTYSITGPQPINVMWFGAKADARKVIDGSMSSSGSTLTSSLAAFTSADVNKVIDVSGTGASASDTQGVTARHNKVGTISAYTSATQVTLSFTSSATVVDKTFHYGTDDSDAVTAAIASAGDAPACIYFPCGNYLINDTFVLPSNISLAGDGQGVSNLYWVGPTRNSGAGFTLLSIPDATVKVNIYDLSILGTNVTAIGVTSVAGLYSAIKPGTGSGGSIEDLNFYNIDVGYIWGFGFRSDGDFGDQAGNPPTNINYNINDCYVHHNGDNGINLNTGGGLTVARCKITYNGKGGIEFAGSRGKFVNNYVAHNLNVGIAAGGLGNPSLGKDIQVLGNTVERNGSNGSGDGISAGGNVVHCIIANNIARENELNGIRIGDGNPDFASLSRDIRVVNNQCMSNGAGFPGCGIQVSMNDVVVQGNDVFDDGVSGYAQYYGIYTKQDNVRLINNYVHGNTNTDYIFIQNSNARLAYDNISAVLSQFEGNGWQGTVDTSSTTATYKTGDLFNSRWVGVPIKINSVPYTITAVAAAPSGNFTSSGLTITRTSGTNFSSAWIGQYIKLGPSLYFPITAVADASHLTISNAIGNTVPASGAWALNGSVSLTLSASAGTQTGVAYVIPPHVIQTGEVSTSLVAVGSAVALTTATPANVTSLVLGPGNWDVEGNVNFTAVGGTQTAAQAGINTTSATLPTDGSEVYSGLQTAVITEKDSITVPRKRIVVTSTTVVYLVAQVTFAAGTVGAFGLLSARRA